MLNSFWKKGNDSRWLRIIGVAVSFALTALLLWNPPLLNELRLKSFDLLLRQMPAPMAKQSVVIVDIDAKSLAALGQWPWPRTQIATLITRIAAEKPAVIGFDMVFAEPDRTSPHRLAAAEKPDNMPPAVRSYLSTLPDHDQLLADTFAASSVPVVIGHLFTKKNEAAGKNIPRSGGAVLRGEYPEVFLPSFSEADANLPLFEQSAQGSGFFNIIPDDDSIARRLPLLISFRGEVYPSLVLAMLQAANRKQPVIVDSNENGVRTVQVGPHRIPTTRRGEMTVHFTSQLDLFRRISAAALVQDDDNAPKLGLQDAYVIIGASAIGLFDSIAVPGGKISRGVEFHCQALNTILTGSFFEQPEWGLGIEILQLFLVCLLLVLLVPRTGAIGGALLLLGAICGTIAFSWWNIRQNHLLIDIVMPATAAALIFMVLTSVNYFTEEKKVRWLRSAFAQYLAPAVVEELVKNKDRLILSGEERELSILFSDIRGFTRLAETMRPEALCAFLNEYLTPMTAAVMNRRGTVDKFIGDAVMAFWNAPLATPNHARHACESALAMLKELESLNSSWLQRGLPTIRIGIGIHCGTVRVGNMGSQQRFEYTVIGDTVNLASRLEGLTKLYGTDILVSGAVHEMLKHSSFAFRQVDTVRVMGKSETVEVYQLLGKHEQYKAQERAEIQLHANALMLYRNGDFQKAEVLFQQLAQMAPEDKLYILYMTRCGQLAENPPAHWDGITDMRSK